MADIAVVDSKLYGLLAGAGCSHGSTLIPDAAVSVETKTGAWPILADLSDFVQTHPAKYVDPDDFEPDGVFRHLGKVVRLKREGVIEDVATGLSVPTAMTFGPNGRLSVSNVGAAPAGMDRSSA